MLGVSACRPISFSRHEVDLLQAVGNVIGVAVQNVWLFEESQRQEEIQRLLEGSPSEDVYLAPFTSYVLSFPIRHGIAWEQPLRTTLFKKGTVQYKVQSEHEELTPVDDQPLRTGRLRNKYVHFSMPSLTKYLTKLEYYTERDHERADPKDIRVLSSLRLIWSVPRYFFQQYVIKRGYKDGEH